MTTEYRVHLDRGACEGVFACLVRDDRFREAEDGLATFEGSSDTDEGADMQTDGGQTVIFDCDDDQIEAARGAAAACPVAAIDVVAEGGDE